MKTKILNLYNQFQTIELDTWLDGRNYSDAFVICVGAGPWKYQRRYNIQKTALEKLAGRDLSAVKKVDWYPLKWQNDFVNNLYKYLKENNYTMESYCEELKNLANYTDYSARNSLYAACGTKYAKVLSLFCRDALRIPSFPIDRHVRKYLLKNDLFDNEADLVELCKDAGINPIYFATAIVKQIGNVDNPDWSINNKEL